MNKNMMKKIPLDLNTINNNKVNNYNLNTGTREIHKNPQVFQNSLNKPTIGSIKKKKRVCFIDQVQSEKNIAQIIYINDKVSLQEDKIDPKDYVEMYRKQSTNISELFKKNGNNETINDIYKIKRPKHSSFNKIKKDDSVEEQCSCIIF